jgi:hypothetical protein
MGHGLWNPGKLLLSTLTLRSYRKLTIPCEP